MCQCHEEVGSLSSETGIIECLIRLPCSHLVGSHCIATWLHDNNTCPVCRREFFPSRSRPPFIHNIIISRVGDDDAGDVGGDQEALQRLLQEIDRVSRRLELNPAVSLLSKLIATLSFPLDALRGSSWRPRAAISVFAASHLLGRAVTTDRIAPAVGLTQRSIYETYGRFYPERRIVSDDRDFIQLVDARSERVWRRSPTPPDWPRPDWPRLMYADAISNMMTSYFEPEHEAIFIEVTIGIVSVLAVKPYFNDEEISRVLALSIYLASYLRQTPLSCAEISAATGVSVDDLRALYAVFYPHREDLLECRTFASTDNNSFERLVADLPPEIP